MYSFMYPFKMFSGGCVIGSERLNYNLYIPIWFVVWLYCYLFDRMYTLLIHSCAWWEKLGVWRAVCKYKRCLTNSNQSRGMLLHIHDCSRTSQPIAGELSGIFTRSSDDERFLCVWMRERRESREELSASSRAEKRIKLNKTLEIIRIKESMLSRVLLRAGCWCWWGSQRRVEESNPFPWCTAEFLSTCRTAVRGSWRTWCPACGSWRAPDRGRRD